MTGTSGAAWVEACIRSQGRVLVGLHAHWCPDVEGRPVDETIGEYAACRCFEPRVPDAADVLADHLTDDGSEVV